MTVYGDAAYGAGDFLHQLEQAGAGIKCKVQPPVAPAGRFAKDHFHIDLTGRAHATARDSPAAVAGNCASCPTAVVAGATTANE